LRVVIEASWKCGAGRSGVDETGEVDDSALLSRFVVEIDRLKEISDLSSPARQAGTPSNDACEP
jgi:hypothetical protein